MGTMPAPGAQHGYANKLSTARVNDERHEADLHRAESCLLCDYSEGQADGKIAETDGPRAYNAILNYRCPVDSFFMGISRY